MTKIANKEKKNIKNRNKNNGVHVSPYLESYIRFTGVFNPDGTPNLFARLIYTI